MLEFYPTLSAVTRFDLEKQKYLTDQPAETFLTQLLGKDNAKENLPYQWRLLPKGEGTAFMFEDPAEAQSLRKAGSKNLFHELNCLKVVPIGVFVSVP